MFTRIITVCLSVCLSDNWFLVTKNGQIMSLPSYMCVCLCACVCVCYGFIRESFYFLFCRIWTCFYRLSGRFGIDSWSAILGDLFLLYDVYRGTRQSGEWCISGDHTSNVGYIMRTLRTAKTTRSLWPVKNWLMGCWLTGILTRLKYNRIISNFNAEKRF